MLGELSDEWHTIGTGRHTTRLSQSGEVQGLDGATLLEEEQRELIQIIHKKVLNRDEI